MTTQRHITLQQQPNPDKQGAFIYVVIETRNTIGWHIGDVLYPSDIAMLEGRNSISFTVRGAKEP